MTKLSQAQLVTAVRGNAFPTITMYNRLEGRPRTADFTRALRAEVRDALWFLTKQWQLGEFVGDDAGSPLGAQVEIATTHLSQLTANGVTSAYDDNTPLEAKVEQQAIAFLRGTSKLQLDLRVELGRFFGKLLDKDGLTSYRVAYLAKYPFVLPALDRSNPAADVYAHPRAWQQLAAIAGRAIDGGDLYLYLKASATNKASDGITLAAAGDGPALDAIGVRIVAWFDALYFQPTNAGGWQPDTLDYSFSVSAPYPGSPKQLVASQFPGGYLDWYAFDVYEPAPAPALQLIAQPQPSVSASIPTLAAAATTRRPEPTPIPRPNPTPVQTDPRTRTTKSFLPAPLRFDGMPNPRWWMFEDNRVGFGQISPSTTDIGKLLLVEFALVYANDWFLLPFTLAAGSLADITAMTVTNSFDERYWIEPAGAGAENNWQSWRMFTLDAEGATTADTSLFLAPAVPKIQSGAPLDEVFLVLDEMANMAWAIESQVPLISGLPYDGTTVGREVTAYQRAQIGPAAAPAPYAASIYYDAMTGVPENWIPVIGVQTPGQSREIQLQRGAMLRVLDGDPQPPVKIEPQTPTMRAGLDQPTPQPYYIAEQEVPRAGTRLVRAFQRTRWRNGATFVWLGMAKETGKGTARSALAFDQIETSPPASH
jgi:hypothetical protein